MKPCDSIPVCALRLFAALLMCTSFACGSSTPPAAKPPSPPRAHASETEATPPPGPTATSAPETEPPKTEPEPEPEPDPDPEPEPAAETDADAATAETQPSPQRAEVVNGQVTVRMTGFRNAKGRALVGLYTTRKGFPRRRKSATHNSRARIRGGRAVAVIKNVPPGEFAIAVLHDEDGDRKMTKNFLGIPQEGFGFSRNPKVRFSAPSWQESALRLAPGKKVHVDIRIEYK